MTDYQIKKMSLIFRSAIEAAMEDNQFERDLRFMRFPKGCCGDTCYLLAEFLRNEGVESIWCSTERGDWSHAWLVVKDNRIQLPVQKTVSFPEELRPVLANYGIENPAQGIVNKNYMFDDLQDGLIIDITADQFPDYNIPVYVGLMDAFHKSFSFIQAYDNFELRDCRLVELYQIIIKYL